MTLIVSDSIKSLVPCLKFKVKIVPQSSIDSLDHSLRCNFVSQSQVFPTFASYVSSTSLANFFNEAKFILAIDLSTGHFYLSSVFLKFGSRTKGKTISCTVAMSR